MSRGDANTCGQGEVNNMKKSIGIIALVAFLAASSFGQDIPNYPDNSSLGYKSSIMGNFDNADPQDEIIVDFGSAGVWYYDGGHWYSQSSLNPEAMISVLADGVDDEEAVFDFGMTGLWYWDLGAWTQLSVVDSQGMFAVDDDFDSRQEMQVDFGALGVWRYDWDDLSWTQLSGLDPYNGLRTDFGEAGHEEGCWSFPGAGVWTISKSAASDTWSYEQLTGTENADKDRLSAHFTDVAGPEDLVVDFGSLGLWLCKGSDKSWMKISPMSAKLIKEVRFADDAAAELLAEDENGGLYMGNWNGDGFTWTLITSEQLASSSAALETFDQDGTDGGDEEIIIPLASGGASIYDFSAGGSLSPFVNGAYILISSIKGDYYGRGHDSTLAVAFGAGSASPGFWLYERDSNPALSGWTRLSISIPDGGF